MSEFRQYRRKQIAELREYELGEILSDRVSVSAPDREAGSPATRGGMTSEQQQQVERIERLYTQTRHMLEAAAHAHSDDGTGRCRFCAAVKANASTRTS